LVSAAPSLSDVTASIRTPKPQSDDDPEESALAETTWRREMRMSIKRESSCLLGVPTTSTQSDPVVGGCKDMGRLALQMISSNTSPTTSSGKSIKPLGSQPVVSQDASQIETELGGLLDKPDDSIADRVRIAAKAQASACWEDLISFLEMNKLSGAYALAISAFGVEDLSQLLLLDNEQLGKLLESCKMDAMDEILLLEALRNAR